MATIGLSDLYYAKITMSDDGETYAAPVKLAKAISANLNIETAEGTLYADDMASEVVKEFKGGKITLNIDDIGAAKAADLLGATVDKNGAVVYAAENTSNAVAIGFKAKRSDGKYKYFWLYKVTFGVPSDSLQTKGDSINFATPTIEGIIAARQKLDAYGKHPWKADITETDSNTATISSWFAQVYEPVEESA